MLLKLQLSTRRETSKKATDNTWV